MFTNNDQNNCPIQSCEIMNAECLEPLMTDEIVKYEPKDKTVLANSRIKEGYTIMFCLICVTSPMNKKFKKSIFKINGIKI